MKYTIAIMALIAAAPAHAERLDTSGFYGTGGWGQQADSYTPSNPSPGRGGTYDGDDGYRPSWAGNARTLPDTPSFKDFKHNPFFNGWRK